MALGGGVSAVYIDVSTFKVSGQTDSQSGAAYTDIFTLGRQVRADLGADGVIVAPVSSSSYNSTADETTVNLARPKLTSNLDTIWWGISGREALPYTPIWRTWFGV